MSKKASYYNEMNETDKEINHKIIKNMNKRVNYLKNPRYKVNKNPNFFSYINTKQEIVTQKDQVTSVRVTPKQIIFRDYMINGIYEISLYVTNATKLLQRIKILPPAKQEFMIAEIKYPSIDEGTIASGMSAILKIRFNPSSLAEFDDQIAILTEDHILKVPLLARKEPPQLDLPPLLDCQSCWLGDHVETSFVVKNTGGEAGYRFFIPGMDYQEEGGENVIHIGNFQLTPVEFFLSKGDTQVIHAIYKPDREGEVTEEIILGCDNQTESKLKLMGKGNMVELKISGIDETDLEQQSEQLKKIFFNHPIPNQPTIRKLILRNKTSVRVKYHWSLFTTENELNLGDDQNVFSISPFEGYFEPNSNITFEISLKSEEYYPLFQFANLIIDDIPFESIRNPPPSLLAQFENHNTIVIGANSIKPSITYFEFELISKTALSKVESQPPFYRFPVATCINTLQKYSFKLKSNNNSKLKYQITPVHYGTALEEYIQQKEGVFQDEQTIELGFTAVKVGTSHIAYRIDFDYADSILITIYANIVAPEIQIDLPWLNYGLIQTYSLESRELSITNISVVPATVKVESMSDQRLVFNRDPIDLNPGQIVKYKVEFNSREAETYQDFLSFTVEHGECTVLDVFAEVQTPSVSLNRLNLHVDTLYCGNTYTFDQRAQQYIVLQNLGNIPTPFEWQLPQSTEKYIVQFEPRKGVLKPKTNQTIKFSIKPKQGGQLNELFVCEVHGLQYPLGFEMNTLVYGLSVEYELIDDQAHVSSKVSVHSKSNKSLNQTRQSILKSSDGVAEPQIKNQSMEKLEFFNCFINKPKQAKFLIKNTSGISTQFSLSMKKYQPQPLDELQSTLQDDFDAKSRTIKFAESSISKSVNKKGKITQGGRPVILLTNKIEKTQNFTSEAGQQLNKQKKMENDQRHYLSNNLGVAVVFEPPSGTLNAYGSVVIQVTAFNDICGLYEDTVFCDIRGLTIKEFPFQIDIKGSPIIISPNQLGFNYKGDYPSYELGTFMRNSGSITREFRVQNTGPQDVEIEWKIYNLGNTDGKDFFTIAITDPPLGSDQLCDVKFIANVPPESTEGPFHVTPQRERIRGRREKHFTINYQTGISGRYQACIVAQPRMLTSDQPIGEVALYINADTITPKLYFDKLERVDNQGHLVKFVKFSNGPNKRQQKRLVLVNQQKSSLVCSLEIEGPFKLAKSSTNSPQKYELEAKTKNEVAKTFNLVQNSHMELEILFEGYLPSDNQNWPLTYKVYNQGLLRIFFANGDEQIIYFEGVLLRPYIHLNTSGIDMLEGPEIIDFGNVREEKILSIFISNLSTVPAIWKLQHQKNPLRTNIVETTMTMLDKEEMAKTDDPSVFSFQVTEGNLLGPSTMVHTLPHATALPHRITLEDIHDLGIIPQKIQIIFKPKEEKMYKSKYRIKVQDGPFVEFTLKGTGKDLIIRKI